MKDVSKDISIGTQIPPLEKLVTLEISQAFSYWPQLRTFHTDEKTAKEFGFPSVLMQGQLGVDYLSQMCYNFFGDAWYRSGKLEVNFVAPVFVPKRLTARGVINEMESEGPRTVVKLDIWLENENGQKVQVGKASCSIES